MLCSFCSKSEPVRIEISSLNLRICPNCLATFLPAAQFPALRRDVAKATKGAWIRRLKVALQATPSESLNSVPINCLEHGAPLENGTIPDYSFEGPVPKCCDLQHLPPSLAVKILELGLDSPRIPGSMLGASSSKINPVSKFLGGIVFYFWEKRQKNIDDGLDRLQYNFKFKDVLGEWIPE
jgi:hypothetical protein